MPDPVARLGEALSDRYTIERPLGEGGMATVYLAHDVRHDRPVAIKVLRPELAAVLGVQRFLAEIRTTAGLQHPHILPLHDSGEVDGLLFYVMPYVDGETLRERLDREGPLPVDAAVAIAIDVADGLSCAHQAGVVHRDIKPANILMSRGHALVADFGIASALSEAGGERLTETGLSLGTPAYMSPEQVTGDAPADARSDVYALGCVVYEMLVGDPPFAGTHARAILARKTIESPPSIRTVRATVPEHIERAVLRAIATLPADRFLTVDAFADALGPDAAGAHGAPPVPQRKGRRVVLIGGSILAGLGLAGWVLVSLSGGSAIPDLSSMTVRPLTSFVGWEHSPSWSPDGSMIAYSHIVGGDADVATLAVSGGEPHILTSESPADEFTPRWSPDGGRIAYASDRGAGTDIYLIHPTGGPEQKLVETRIPFLERQGAWASALGTNAWSPGGDELVFSRLEDSGAVALWKVDVPTRVETRLTSPPAGVEDGWGSWSPDGRTILFVRKDSGTRALWQIDEDGRDPTRVFDEPVHQPAWFPDGRRVAFASRRGGAFNLWELDLPSGALRQLTQGAGLDWTPAISVDGVVAFQQFGHEIELRSGPIDVPDEAHQRLTSFTGDNFGARVSPDGSRILYYSNRSGGHDIWVLDRATGQHRRVTDDPASDRLADWSPNGAEIVFLSNRGGDVQLWVADAETGATRLLHEHALPWEEHQAEAQGAPRWSPDGRLIGYLAPAGGERAIWVVSTDGTDARPTEIRGALSFEWYLGSERILYTKHAGDDSGLVELRAARLGTDDDILIQSGPLAEVASSLDGTFVSFIQSPSHFTMELYVLRLAPPDPRDGLPRALGTPRRVTSGGGAWHVHNGGWFPDGNTVVYSRDRDFGDLFLIEPSK